MKTENVDITKCRFLLFSNINKYIQYNSATLKKHEFNPCFFKYWATLALANTALPASKM